MCPLPRVVFQRRAASPWAASAPRWAPCRLPTLMISPTRPSTTRSPHLRSTRGLRVKYLCPRPLLPRCPAATSAAWGPSLSWSLPRTGTAQSSSLSSSREGGKGEGLEEENRTKANEEGAKAGMGWLLALHYLQTGVNSSYEGLALLWCWEESYTGITTEHMNFFKIQNNLLWILLLGLSHWKMNWCEYKAERSIHKLYCI